MNKHETTAWLAEHGLDYTRGTIEHVSAWATGLDNEQEFCDYADDEIVRIKPGKTWGLRRWNPLDNMADAWLLVEAMVKQGGSPNLVFDDNLIEEQGAWCCTCDGWNSVPDPDNEDIEQMQFTALCDYWYSTPMLAICADAARRAGKILVQEEENRFELYDEPPVEMTPWMQEFMRKMEGEMEDGTTEEGTPGTDG